MKRLSQPEGAIALEALWALHWMGSLDEPTALASLAHPDPDVRLWTVRLLCDERTVSRKVAAALVKLSVTAKQISTCSANWPVRLDGFRPAMRFPCCATWRDTTPS